MSDTQMENKALGLYLSEGITKGNILTLLLICASSIMLATFVPAVQPYLLSEVLMIPTAEQGVVSGNLKFWSEVMVIAAVGVWGALSDKIGRKNVTVAGYALTAVAMLVYGTSESYVQLLIATLIYSVGIAAITSMIITLMADYALNKSRGKTTGYVGFMNGIGAMIAALGLVKLPSFFQNSGMVANEAAVATFTAMGGILLVVIILVALGLHKGTHRKTKEPVRTLSQLKMGFKAVSRPGISLAYASAFLSRGNLAVIGTFFPLWASVYGSTELGMSTGEALSLGGAILSISYAAALLAAPIFGIMTDKMNRVSALMVTLVISTIGYTATYFIADPFGVPMMITLVIIGMAEVGCIITSGVLVAEQSRVEIRGAVIGVFTLCGALGILVVSLVGGHLFDKWLYTGPFVFFGVIAFVVLIWAWLAKKKIYADQEETTATNP